MTRRRSTAARPEACRALVTGGSGGIGQAICHKLAESGCHVIVHAGRNLEQAEATVESIKGSGGRAESVQFDLSDGPACQSAMNELLAEQPLGIVVHNAGLHDDAPLAGMSAEQWQRVVDINLNGFFRVVQPALLGMARLRWGRVVAISSVAGRIGNRGQANYAAAKAGMMGLLRTAVLELTRLGIRTNAVWPIAETDMTEVVFTRAEASAKEKGVAAPDPVELGFGKPEEVAEGLVWLASEDAARFNGQCLTFNGRKIALWTHPEEQHITFREAPFSADDLAAHFRDVTPLPLYQPRMRPD